ncbi:hypothetical protein [Streptomyces sp. NPDC057107]|uniref:hypothetical protein n=1 Tax=Streptomyces sp. NPDC057107 TaxID=3346021 RepID=UPI00363F6C56
MLSRPRSILFWLVLIILLNIIATAPTELAHTIQTAVHATKQFFHSLGILIDTLAES